MSDMRPVRLTALLSRPPKEQPDSNALLTAAHNEGFATAQAISAVRIEQLEADLRELRERMETEKNAQETAYAAALSALENGFAQAVTHTALGIAKAILGTEAQLPAETLKSLIEDALSALPEGQIGQIRMHPDHLSVARRWLPAGWQAVADTNLPLGEMMAEAGASIALAGINERLAEMSHRLGQTA